jgi:endonuclease-3 related protein
MLFGASRWSSVVGRSVVGRSGFAESFDNRAFAPWPHDDYGVETSSASILPALLSVVKRYKSLGHSSSTPMTNDPRPSTPYNSKGAMKTATESQHDAIRAYYHALFSAWGRQHWWPAQSRLEVIVGAYLTQNTSWTNVEKALGKLRKAGLLTISGIRRAPQPELEQWIRPAGYFRQKAQRLKTFVRFLDARYGGSLARMFARPTAELRDELLALNGVGPETADSILLYAGDHPVFVVDAYTRRILERHEIVSSVAGYEDIRLLVEQALGDVPAPEGLSPPRRRERRETSRSSSSYCSRNQEVALGVLCVSAVNKYAQGPRGSAHLPSAVSEAARPPRVQVFNEMHGLIVGVSKTFCLKSQPRCEQCPLQKFLPRAK